MPATSHYVKAIVAAVWDNPLGKPGEAHQTAFNALHDEALREEAARRADAYVNARTSHQTSDLPQTRWFEDELITGMLAKMTHRAMYNEDHAFCARDCMNPDHGVAYLEQEITVFLGDDYSHMFDLFKES